MQVNNIIHLDDKLLLLKIDFFSFSNRLALADFKSRIMYANV